MDEVYGVVFDYERPEGIIYFLPPGCTRVLWYSADGAEFYDRPAPTGQQSDAFLDTPVMRKVAETGKYKLDIAVRALFPKFASARLVPEPPKESGR